MDYITSEWNGFKRIDFLFEGKKAILVFPNVPINGGKWLFKTEYFGAFPDFEIEMLKKGYYLANIENTTRWCLEEDTKRQYDFALFLQKEFNLNKKCVPVGMSCGGMQAVYFGAKHPEAVAALYLDAPVLNFLSCPCSIGKAKNDDYIYEEFVSATGFTLIDMINYRKHPIDYADKLIENDIPVFLICGDSDTIVPFEENGKCLYQKYIASGKPIVKVLKENCDHHPHGLSDNKPLIDFVEKYY